MFNPTLHAPDTVILDKTGTCRSVDQSLGLFFWKSFFLMIISNLAYDKCLKTVKGQQACHKNIGSQTIQRDSDKSSVDSLVFLRPNPHAAGDIPFAGIPKSWISSSRKRAALTTTCCELSVVTVTEMERHQADFLASSVQHHPSSSGAKGGNLLTQ